MQNLRINNRFSTILVIATSVCLGTISPTYANTNGDISLPSMGTDTSTRLSAEDQQLLGEAFMRQVRRELPLFDDPEIDNYVRDLGFRLVSNSDHRARHFDFFAIDNQSINAFAGPAGYIGIHSGLILAAETEGELAAVMAHEIAHVTQHHLDRALDEANKLSLPTAAAIVAAVILGSQNANITEAAILATMAANIQRQLNFTRTHEREADHIGMQILAHSQFDPYAMPAFFERLQQSDRLFDAQVPEFLRTHPVTLNRIAESRDRANHYDFKPIPDSLEFHFIKAKLRVASATNPADIVRRYEAKLEAGSYTYKNAELYGYALALLRHRDYEQARKIIENLIKSDRERIPYVIARANIEIADGNVEKGLNIYFDALNLYPGNSSLQLNYASSLLQHQQPEASAAILERLLKERQTPSLYQMLAKARGESRQPIEAHQALAEYYFMTGYTRIAIEQLSLALKQKSISDKQKSLIEARMQRFKEIALAEKEL